LKEEKYIKKTIARLFELPPEIILNLPMITLIGKDELSVENYKSIIEYGGETIRINTSCGIIKIEGRGLVLKQVTSENILVTGQILKFEYI
jgi:sporulation protein YqfC